MEKETSGSVLKENMSRRKKYNNDLTRFIKYTGDGMDGASRNAFEKSLQKDPFDAEAAEGFAMVTGEEAREDMDIISRRLARRREAGGGFFIIRAAAVACILVVTTVFISNLEKGTSKPLLSENLMPGKETTTLPVVEGRSVTREAPAESASEIVVPMTESAGSRNAGNAMADTQELIAAVDRRSIDEIPLQDLAEQKLSNFRLEEDMEAKLKKEPAQATRGVIRGTVISNEDGLPVPGASVIIKGTTTGVVTDVNGRFALNAGTDSTMDIIAQFIGMQAQEIQARPDTDLLIAMNADRMALDEVVVVAMGTSKKENATGSVSTVTIDNKAAQPYDHTPAEPSTGREAFKKYIRDNLRYPADAEVKSRQTVVLSVMVESNGSLSSIEVVRSPSQSFSDEAVRLIKEGPRWKPAMENGVNRSESVRVRIVFDPPQD